MLATLLMLTACGPTRDNYLDRVATVSCRKTQQCQPDEFEQVYDDVDQCVDFTVTLMAAFGYDESCYDDCDFSSVKAQACIDSLRETSCDELESGETTTDPACDEVYACEDEAAVSECMSLSWGGDTGQ